DLNRDKLLALFTPGDYNSLNEADKNAVDYTTNSMMLYIKPATCLHFKTELALTKAKKSTAQIRANYNAKKDLLATSKVNEAIEAADFPKNDKILGDVVASKVSTTLNKRKQRRQKQLAKQTAKNRTDKGDEKGKQTGKKHTGDKHTGKKPDKLAHKRHGPQGKHPKGRDQQQPPADTNPKGNPTKKARFKGILKNKQDTAQQSSSEDEADDPQDTEEATTLHQSNQGTGHRRPKNKNKRKKPPHKGPNPKGRHKPGKRQHQS
ncbi:MAG: hypothetical protein ACRCT2_06460, partial [Plesiomonas shigelloides]